MVKENPYFRIFYEVILMRCMETSNKHYFPGSLDFLPVFSQVKTAIFLDAKGAYSLDKNINNIRGILRIGMWYETKMHRACSWFYVNDEVKN